MAVLHQVSGGNVFLQGTHLAIGIGTTGSFGTSINAPAGFYTDQAHGFFNLGIYADLDGFGIGEEPTFQDATVPGSPEERFNVGYRLAPGGEATVYTNSDLEPGFGTALPTLAVTDLSTAGKLEASWLGGFTNGLKVEQVVSFDPDNSYFQVSITLTNASAAALYDVVYMRNVDPDQAPGAVTENRIFEQNPDGALVAAYVPGEGEGTGTFPFFYYSTDPRAVVANFGFTNTDPYAPELTTAKQPEGYSDISDTGIAIAFNVGTLAAGASATLTFYIGMAADLDEVIESIVPDINERPTSSNDTITTSEDVSKVLALSDFGTYSDPQGTPLAKVQITQLETNGGLEYDTTGSGTWVGVTLNQEISAAHIAAGRLRFKPDANENGGPYATVRFKVSDGSVYSDAAYTLTVNVTAVNDAPTAVITPASYAATEQVSLSLKNSGLSVGDVDSGGGSVSVTLSVVAGVLNVTAGTSGATVTNSGTSSVTIAGTLAQINALLNSNSTSTVAYLNSSNKPAASTTLTLTVNDKGNSGTGGAKTASDTATINIAAVNDAPVNTVPGAKTFNNLNTAFAIGGVSVADADSSAVTTTLSVLHGVLNVTAASGTTITGNGTGTVKITGAPASVNAALAGLTYLALNYSGPDTLKVSTTDGVAAADVDSIAITVKPGTVITNGVGTLFGSTGPDAITGDSAANDIRGFDGNDILDGGGGTGVDRLWGEGGNDTLFGRGGNDQLAGGLGNDTLLLGDGADTGWGEDGSDTIIGEGGADTVYGGAGNDTIWLDNLNNTAGATGDDRAWGGAGNDTIHGGGGSDQIVGEDGNDTLFGDDGNDFLFGDAGNDIFFGGGGNDQYVGGAGSDTLHFDAGTDIAWGGADGDIFVFTPGNGRDTVKDYGVETATSRDRLQFDGFSSTAVSTQQITVDGKTGLQVSIGAEAVAFLEGVTTLTSDDLLFIA